MTGPVGRPVGPGRSRPALTHLGTGSGLVSAAAAVSGPQPRGPGVLKAGETLFQAMKTNKQSHLSQFQACLSILQMARVALLISQGMFLFFFILFCWFSLKPKAEDLSAFEPSK